MLRLGTTIYGDIDVDAVLEELDTIRLMRLFFRRRWRIAARHVGCGHLIQVPLGSLILGGEDEETDAQLLARMPRLPPPRVIHPLYERLGVVALLPLPIAV